MDDEDLNREHRREAALKSMIAVDPLQTVEHFKEYFGGEDAVWTDWDLKFVKFIEQNRRTGLIYGTIGDGWHFLFSPPAADGIWICTQEDVKGKGFLRPESIQALTKLAVEKGLVTGA